MWFRSGTARRTWLAFGALFVLFGGSSMLGLAGLQEMHETMHQLRDREADVRSALELTRAVRDQYAHQAHTIILGNLSHLPMYDEARQSVEQLLAATAAQAHGKEGSRAVEAISRTSQEMDRLFREQIVPAVVAKDSAAISQAHNALLELVMNAENDADQLADFYESQIGSFEAHGSSVQHTAYRWMVTIAVVATFFSLAIGFYLSRSITGPVAALGKGAARLAAGDLTTTIEVGGNDELGQLAQQFNSMTSALAQHQRTLVQNEKLASLGRLAAGVAHEINNPLGVILGYARLMGRKADGELREELRIIEDEAKRCQFIVEGLLELARPIEVEDCEVDLRELCLETVERLKDSGGAEGVEFRVDGEVKVRGTEHRLRQVVLNLATNAARAAGSGGKVSLALREDGSGAELRVMDTGPGVPQELRSRVFEPFFTTRAEGTGLGLAVSRAIARAHGGDLQLEEATAGATFTLRLPRLARRSAA